MDKKDLYEHLANIYLDASSKRKGKKPRNHPDFFRHLFIASVAVICVLLCVLVAMPLRYRAILGSFSNVRLTKTEFSLLLQPDIVKINFDFQPAKEEIYSINLGNLDASKFRSLGFSVRKANFSDRIALVVEFATSLNEKDKVYINEIPSFKWKAVRFDLKDLKGITDWSKALRLSFIVEDGTTRAQKGIVYIDEVRLIR